MRKDFVMEKGGTISIEMLKVVATRIASSHFGIAWSSSARTVNDQKVREM